MTVKKVDLSKIKRLRKSLNISFSEMSEMLGYESQNGYYYLEAGRNKFSAETLAKVAEILNVSIEELFFIDKIAKKAKNKSTA